MTLLYDDRFAPITTSTGFVGADVKAAADAYASWMGGVEKQHGRKLQARELEGSLDQLLPALLPLRSGTKTKALLVPTRGNWVAYFDNFVLGTDASPVMSQMALLLKTQAVTMTAIVPERENLRPAGARDPATILEIFEPENTDWLNRGRSLALVNDGRWTFEQGGTPQPFEEPGVYRAPKVKDRFPVALLARYLKALGIEAFDQNFYMPPGTKAVLFEKVGSFPKPPQEFTLEQALSRHT